MSIYLAPDATGRGVGTALLSRLLDELRALGRHVAVAGLTVPNAASRALVSRFGFEPVGVFREVGFKQGRYWDVEWLEKRL